MKDQDLEGLTEKLREATAPEIRKQIWEQLYARFRRMARGEIGRTGQQGQESSGDVVHAIYEGVDRAMANPEKEFENRYRYLSYVATSMRNLVVGRAKKRMLEELEDDLITVETASTELILTLHRHMEKLKQKHPRAMQAFELRYFAGCGHDEIMQQMPEYRSKALLASDLGRIRKLLAESIDHE